jgi:hypothetical protein
MGVYAEVREFVQAHRPCAGPRQTNAGPSTVSGYRLVAVCGCGAEFKRWVTQDDADEDLLVRRCSRSRTSRPLAAQLLSRAKADTTAKRH